MYIVREPSCNSKSIGTFRNPGVPNYAFLTREITMQKKVNIYACGGTANIVGMLFWQTTPIFDVPRPGQRCPSPSWTLPAQTYLRFQEDKFYHIHDPSVHR